MEPRTLILTSYMAPHRIATWQNAICLLVDEKIDVLEAYEATVSSPSLTLQIPAVARLRQVISPNKKGIKFSRVNVYSRDGFRCCYCGDRKTARELTYDHVLPRSKGGTTTWGNIVTCCKACNRKKDNRTPQVAGMRMHFKPHRPTMLPMTTPVLMLADQIPEQWRPYLEGIVRTA